MWPEKIIDLFSAVDWESNDESELYGPYNALLDFCFPWEEGWNIVPQPKKRETIDFTTIYSIEKKKIPIFFLEIKPLHHIFNIATREAADEQMRDRFVSLLPLIVTPKLHGISALGKKLSHYCLDKTTRELQPIGIQRDPQYIIDTAPSERWDIDILDADGCNRFNEIVGTVKQMSAEL
jgi:hypothetical protein